MSRLDRAFERAHAEKRAALIVFVTAGDPDLRTTAELVPALAEAGADVVELGVPHSDPIAEGPTIQASSFRALQQGTTLAAILEVCREVRAASEVPLVLMGYLNNVLAFGEERLVEACAAVGVDGLIVADVPFEEASVLQAASEAMACTARCSEPVTSTKPSSRSAAWCAATSAASAVACSGASDHENPPVAMSRAGAGGSSTASRSWA